MPFKPGKLHEIRGKSNDKNTQVVCIATGATVAEAVSAADRLQEKGISMTVWNAHSLKPFDDQTVIRIAHGAKLMVTVEDHTVIGGLGSCVAEALSQTTQHPALMRLGIQDLFGESGEGPELYEKFGISAQAITERVLEKLR
jgi:transketolase